MKFVIVTYIPERQGVLGPIRSKVTIEECETESLEAVKNGLHIPLGGYCLVIKEEDITIVKSKVVNEVAETIPIK